MKQTLALILAGGQGSRLGLLSSQRAKPAVPFGGKYRLIDFTLSNALYSDVHQVGILTQYRPASLMEHIGSGWHWNFIRPFRQLKILPPQYGRNDRDWYQGTADAIYQNLNFIHHFDVDLILILSGDHIYKCDYSEMINFHRRNGADLTIAGIEVPRRMINQFGIINTDAKGTIIDFKEKPAESKSRMASMGVYVFRKSVLEKILKDTYLSGFYDFGKNIIPFMISNFRVFMYPFSGYWRDVGTIFSYWESNMDILRDLPEFSLESWQVITNTGYRVQNVHPPATYQNRAKVINASISNGCDIKGQVVSSILSPGVKIEKNASVYHSVIFHDTVIEEGCTIHSSIIDKDCIIGKNTTIGEPLSMDWDPTNIILPPISVIAKGTHLKENSHVAGGQSIDRD